MTEAESNVKTTISVVYCKPGEKAETVEMEENLETMQAMVGGLIQEFFPFHSDTDPRYDDVALICNDEGKMLGLPLNRGIRGGDGQLQDIIAGDFFLCYAPIESEKFLSLPPDLEAKYKEKFDYPEQFFKTESGIESMKYAPGPEPKEVAMSR